MNTLELTSHFQNLKLHAVGGKKSPHKPLLLLLALGRLQRNEARLMSFADIEMQLADLLEKYSGSDSSRPRPEYPFWHLRTAEFWEITEEQTVPTQSGSAGRKYLRDHQIKAGFNTEAHLLLADNPSMVADLITLLLEDHFPKADHQEILDAAGCCTRIT